MLDAYISQLDPSDQPKLRKLFEKYPFLAELTSGYLRHREFKSLKSDVDRERSTLEEKKSEWLAWYSANRIRYEQMVADLERANGTISLLAAELATARDLIKQ